MADLDDDELLDADVLECEVVVEDAPPAATKSPALFKPAPSPSAAPTVVRGNVPRPAPYNARKGPTLIITRGRP